MKSPQRLPMLGLLLLCRHCLPGLVAVFALLGASTAGAAAGDRLPVVASFSILGDLVGQVGGDRVEVTTLVGPATDAHTYQPTPTDARRLARTRLVVINGLGFEGWIERLIGSAGYRGPVLVASQGVQILHPSSATDGKRSGHSHPRLAADPHAWQDLGNGRRYVHNIAAALTAADPAGKAVYEANATRLNEQLQALDTEIRTTLGALPANKRKVVTSHDAFAYFGRAYGVRFIAPVGVGNDAEPSAADVAAIIRQLRQEQVKSVFLENVTDPRLLQQISRESGARIGGTLYSDSLGRPGTPAATYLGMMRENYRTLRGALVD